MMQNKLSLSKELHTQLESNKVLIRIAGIDEESVVDGPGLRYVVFTQGCHRRCPECHNPQTHDFAGGYEIAISDLLRKIAAVKLISGVTLSGGEPFAQAAACAEIARAVKHLGLNVVTYTGYYHHELIAVAKSDTAIAALLKETDILIDGPYDITQKNLALPFRGSNNQNIIYLKQEHKF